MAENRDIIPVSEDLTPPQIVHALDKYIIGQDKAKKAVAIALRNRTRRKNIDEELRDEIAPKNIIMIGATGVGKTEIARRLARLTDAPFIKVEATKFTEVGYVGRDVESIVRDLVSIAINNQKEIARKKVEKEARQMVEDRLLDLLFPPPRKARQGAAGADGMSGMPVQLGSFSTTLDVPDPSFAGNGDKEKQEEDSYPRTREKMRALLRKGKFEDKTVEIDQAQPRMRNTFIEFIPDSGMEQMDSMLQNVLGNLGNGKKKKIVKVDAARKMLFDQMVDKLIDNDKVIANAISHTENMGIVFLDEIDKIASRESIKGADVSREGVQRDILPLVEGSAVNTRWGVVKTDHILFIAAGAFHMSSPSDLIPELQGRFPIRVELDNLTPDDLKQILTKPKNALITQYKALLATEGITLDFKRDAINEIAKLATEVNRKNDNIGARRLATIMEKLLEDILFRAPDLESDKVVVDKEYVKSRLDDIIEDKDMSKYIL